MVVVPAETPPAMPVELPMVAILTLLLLHTPPGAASVKVVVCPTQTCVLPLMGDGPELTVTTIVA
jgi:hypothetical protein